MLVVGKLDTEMFGELYKKKQSAKTDGNQPTPTNTTAPTPTNLWLDSFAKQEAAPVKFSLTKSGRPMTWKHWFRNDQASNNLIYLPGNQP